MEKTEHALGKGMMKLGGKEIPVRVKLKDVLRFIKGINRAKEAAQEGIDPDRKIVAEEALIDVQAEVAVKIISQGDHKMTEDEVDALVAINYTELSKALPVCLGLATEEKIEEIEAEKTEEKN